VEPLGAPGSSLDLYWIPLGAGNRVVQTSGRLFEAIAARRARRSACPLYHTALVASLDGDRWFIEMTPVPSPVQGPPDRGVVAEGIVGSTVLGRLRVFRYEIRRWCNGAIPDLDDAVASPVPLTDDATSVQAVLASVPSVPTPVWGRDELRAGEMWNSNSVVSWLLTRAGLVDAAGDPPNRGRAPGWDAGVEIAGRDGSTMVRS
jgi:hypothetical protein